jgi:N-acetylglucosamine repressor
MARRKKRSPSAWRVERQLIRYVYEYPDITRQELAARLGQSSAAVSLVIRRLINTGWLRESGRAVSLGGRRPVQLRLSGHRALVVGQSVTADGIRSVVVNPDGDVLAQAQDEKRPSAADLEKRMSAGIRNAIKAAKVQEEQLVGAGLAVSGVVYGETGAAHSVAGLDDAGDVNFLDFLTKLFPDKAVAVDHVSRSRLTWEVYQNSALREQAALLLDLGHEIGTALSAFGTPYKGTDGAPFDAGGIMVSCTGRGGPRTHRLRDAVALGKILERVGRGLDEGRSPLLNDMLDGNPENLTGSLIARAAQAGDGLAFRIVNDTSEAVGDAVATLCNMLRPRTVLLAGELVTSGLLSVEQVRRAVRLAAEPDVYENLRLTVSETEEWGAANGVAHMVLRKWLESLAPSRDGALAES